MRLRQLAFLSCGFVSIRTGGAALALLGQLLLAKLLPLHAVGNYFLATSLAGLFGLLLTGGYPAIATTFLPRYQALTSEKLRLGFLAAARDGITTNIALAAPVVALVLALVPLEAETRLAITAGALAAFAVCLVRMNNAIAISRRRFPLFFVPEYFARPALFLLAVGALNGLFGRISLLEVLCVYLAVALLVCGGQSALLARDSFVQPNAQILTKTQRTAWRSRALAYLVVAAVTISFVDILIFMSGLFLSATELAILGVAAKLAALVGFVTQATQSFATPDLAAAVQLRQSQESRTLLGRAAAVGLGLNALAALGCLIAGGFVLSMFGPQYAKGAPLLVALVFGQLIRSGGGMNAQLLAIDGDQKAVAVICATTVLGLFAMAALTSPYYGLHGIAIAVIAADMLWVTLLALRARQRIGISGDLFALLAR